MPSLEHKPEVVEEKELNDELVAYRVRCCGEEMTDSFHTASVMIDHSAELEAHKQRVAARHEAKQQWRKRNGNQASAQG